MLDLYACGETSPIYLTVGDSPPRSPEDADYSVRWLDRTIEDTAARTDYNDEREREETLGPLRDARRRYEALRDGR